MKPETYFSVLTMIYPKIIRPALQKMVSNTETEFDDFLLMILDRALGYSAPTK